MKRSMLFLWLTLLAAVFFSGCTRDTGNWEVILRSPVSDAPVRGEVAGFLDSKFGIAVGPEGAVRRTVDGGQTWPFGRLRSLCRAGLDIVDERVAWNCGNGGEVFVTTDGAQTWQAVTDYGPDAPRHCRFLSFLDARAGWAATPDQLAATSDGGITWTDLVLPEGIQEIAAIALRTASDGYLLDTQGTLFVTEDGGRTWSSHSLRLKEGEEVRTSFAPRAALRFRDADHALAVLSLFQGNVEGGVWSFHTRDGGRTWMRQAVPARFGAPFLAHDGLTLTAYDSVSREAIVLRYVP